MPAVSENNKKSHKVHQNPKKPTFLVGFFVGVSLILAHKLTQNAEMPTHKVGFLKFKKSHNSRGHRWAEL